MLYIENIDLYSVRFRSVLGGDTYSKVLPKSLEARSDTDDPSRVWIWHTENNECVLNDKLPTEITLNGTIHSTAEAFVVAFNTMIASSVAYTTTTTTTTSTTTTTVAVTTTTTTT